MIKRLGYLALGTRFKRLGDQLQAGVSDALPGSAAVQPAQMPVLAALSEHPRSTVGDLAQTLGVSQPAISRTLGAMAREGLVEAASGDSDQRVRRVSLSAAGAAALAEFRQGLFPQVAAAAQELSRGLEGNLMDQLGQIEDRLRDEDFASRIRRASI